MTTEVIEFSPSQSLGYDFVSSHFHGTMKTQSKENRGENSSI